jgi:hypothetical protein
VGGMAISPEAGRIALEEAGERAYERATAHLRRHHSIWISKEFLERLTQMVGRFWLDGDDRERDKILREKVVPLGEWRAQRCCVFADGAMVPTDGEWHEVRVGTVCSTVGETTRKSSVARFLDVEQFGGELWRKACQYGYAGAALKAFLGDGSHWLWGIAELHFPEAVHILDWYHLAEHLSKCGNEVFGEGTQESKQWAGRLRGIMREGWVEEALREVEQLPGRSKNRRQAKHELITYLTNNRHRVDYPRYRRLGLPIGSGEVEAQCKTLVQARCKQSGMRWSRPGVEPVLRVRCALRDGSFDHLWDHRRASLTAWHKRQMREQKKAA